MKNNVLNMRISDHTKSIIEKLAAKNNRTMTTQVEALIEEHQNSKKLIARLDAIMTRLDAISAKLEEVAK